MKAEDLYEAMQSIRPEFLEESEMESNNKRKLPRRALLIAAVVVVVGAVSATAVGWSLRNAARADAGLKSSIPEWTEYEVEGETVSEAQPQPEAAAVEHEWEPEGGWQDAVTLDSTLCAGENVTAYLRVSGITPEIAASLAQEGGEYAFDIGSLDYHHSCSCGVFYVSYDETGETALVRVELIGIEDVDELQVGLALYRGLEPEVYYEAVTIPVTPSGSLRTEIELALPKGEYRGEMRAVAASVCAGYVEVEFEVTPFRDVASEEELADVETVVLPDGRAINDPLDALVDYLDSWSDRADEALADAALHYRDGTTQKVCELASEYAANWIKEGTDGSADELRALDHVSFRHITTQAIDLSQVVSITIGGVDYPLS